MGAQDSMKFFARVWKHYIYVHVTLLRNQMIEEYFGDLYKEILSLLSPLQRMDNLIELYEDIYSSHCGRVNIKFADFVLDDEDKHNLMMHQNVTNTIKSGEQSDNNSYIHHHHHRHRRQRLHRRGSTNVRRKSGNHHNALLYDAEHKKRRRLRKTKSTLLLDRSLIDLIDNVGPSDLNDTEHDDNDNEIDIDPSNSNDADLRESSVECDINEIDSNHKQYDEDEEKIQLQIEENTKRTKRKTKDDDDDNYDATNQPRLQKISSLSSIF